MAFQLVSSSAIGCLTSRAVPERAGGDGAVLDAEPALEQQRHGRVPHPFVGVVGRDAAQGTVVVADAADDRSEDIGEFGADHQQPFGVRFRRRDLQQRDGFTGAGKGVLDEGCDGKRRDKPA